jgi:hypothetical protein
MESSPAFPRADDARNCRGARKAYTLRAPLSIHNNRDYFRRRFV